MALDEIHSGAKGSLQVRYSGVGGLEYKLEKLVFAFKSEVYAGLAARSSLQVGYRDEANMVRRGM